jgi:hypothetical protein
MIKRYKPTKDNTITNAFGESLTVRGEDANMGLSDILEVFSIYGQVSSSSGFSTEESRILIEFDVDEIQADINSGVVDSGAKFFLRLFNAEHGKTLPRNYNLEVRSVSGSWQEGLGLDMENYSDLTYGYGSSWVSANSNFQKATATLTLTNGPAIVLTASEAGTQMNSRGFQIDVLANGGTDYTVEFTEILIGDKTTALASIKAPFAQAAFTSAEFVEMINTGEVSGKTIILTDPLGLRTLQVASGGGGFSLLNNGNGDLVFDGFDGGSGTWSVEGGDFYGSPISSGSFEIGTEDLEIDVTDHVTEWLADRPNHGLAIKLPSTLSSQTRSFYTKMFFARGSQHFHKRPVLEARWNSQIKDQRVSFFASSSLAPADDNLNTLYLYNYHRGALTDIPAIGQGEIYVGLYDTIGGDALEQCVDTPATGGWVSTGIYTASVCLETTGSEVYDVWHSGSVQYHTGTIEVQQPEALTTPPLSDLVISCTNDQGAYRNNQTSRFYFFIREKDWSPNIYVASPPRPKTKVYDNLMFKISKVITDEVIFDYDTTNLSTTLSYDSNGNYFDLDISMLEPNYVYEIELALFNVMTKSYQVLPFKHRFRVVNNEY